MSHTFHDALPGFDERNIWHDGCPECEARAEAGFSAVHELDQDNRLKAWRLMRAIKWSSGQGIDADHNISSCDVRLASTLYSVAVFLQRCGVEPDELERRMVAENARLLDALRGFGR